MVVTLTRYGHRGSKRPQAYTFFKTLYEINCYLKVYYLENTPLNSCLIISKLKNFMNTFAKVKFSRNFFIQILSSC